MPAERPGENYYEHQFGERIRNIQKSGARPPSTSGSGSGTRGKTAGGAGIVIAIIIVVRAIIGWNSHSSSHDTYKYTPPRQTQFQQPPPVQWQPPPAALPADQRFQPGRDDVLDDEQIRVLIQQNPEVKRIPPAVVPRPPQGPNPFGDRK
jgi:hypothetical protein